MTEFAETHRSFVNTWECDENAHMNVQFYLDRFDEARRLFDLQLPARPRGLPADRHVRFHSECAAATSLLIESARLPSAQVVHRMRDAVSGRLAATALDSDGDVGDRSDSPHDWTPRSLQCAPLVPVRANHFAQQGAIVARQIVVRPAQCDENGLAVERTFISMFTDGAPHVWEHAGVTHDWLARNACGRVAVEMKVTHHGNARAGDALRMVSAAVSRSGRAFTVRHEIVRLPDLAPVVSGKVTGLVMDLGTRRAAGLPESLRLVQVEDFGA